MTKELVYYTAKPLMETPTVDKKLKRQSESWELAKSLEIKPYQHNALNGGIALVIALHTLISEIWTTEQVPSC